MFSFFCPCTPYLYLSVLAGRLSHIVALGLVMYGPCVAIPPNPGETYLQGRRSVDEKNLVRAGWVQCIRGQDSLYRLYPVISGERSRPSGRSVSHLAVVTCWFMYHRLLAFVIYRVSLKIRSALVMIVERITETNSERGCPRTQTAAFRGRLGQQNSSGKSPLHR